MDSTVRKVVFGAMPFLLSDTVGFIRKLPHHLVESFKSTLDEVRESDILLHVVDVSHPQFEDHIETVNLTLKSIEAGDKPTLMVFNKIDLYRERYFDAYLDEDLRLQIEAELQEKLRNKYSFDNVFVSAKTKEKVDVLKPKLEQLIKEMYVVRYPHQARKW